MLAICNWSVVPDRQTIQPISLTRRERTELARWHVVAPPRPRKRSIPVDREIQLLPKIVHPFISTIVHVLTSAPQLFVRRSGVRLEEIRKLPREPFQSRSPAGIMRDDVPREPDRLVLTKPVVPVHNGKRSIVIARAGSKLKRGVDDRVIRGGKHAESRIAAEICQRVQWDRPLWWTTVERLCTGPSSITRVAKIVADAGRPRRSTWGSTTDLSDTL